MASCIKFIICFAIAAFIAVAEAAEEVSPTSTGGNAKIASNEVSADETTQSMFKLNGFGTLGVSHANQNWGDYTLDNTVPKGTGLSQSWAVGNDSRIGVQLSANFTPKTTAVIQVISEYQADSNYHPEVEWANVKYDFNSDAYIRVGRIALPTFLYSDSRKVGHSYPWIHPPLELYRQLSLTNNDGLDAAYRFDISGATNTIKVVYGKSRNELPTSTINSRNLMGIFDTVEFGQALFRFGYQDRDSSSYNFLTGLNSNWNDFSDMSAGVSYDLGDWFAITEWIQRKSTTKIDAMYVSTGFHIKNLSPYLTYCQNSPASFVSGSPAPTVTAIKSAQDSQSTISLGVRWDLMNNTDVKFQFDQVRLNNGSTGFLANVPTGFTQLGTSFHVISVTLDFIF